MLDTIAVRLSHTKIWASPIWICWSKDRTRSRSSSDASLVQRFASFADRSSTARWVAASRPSGAIEEWTTVFGSQRLTGALLDRLTHHVHILELNGESYRLKQSKARRRRDPRPADEAAPAADPETGEITIAS
jgi:hypothetical protein